MKCAAEEMSKKLLSGNVTEKDILDAEVIVRIECFYRKTCRNLLDNLLIERDRVRRITADPTTQEQDKRRYPHLFKDGELAKDDKTRTD